MKIKYNPTSELIIKLRKESNLTLQELADILGVSRAAICQWEQGSGIKTELLYKLAKYFNVTVEELVNGKLNTETLDDYWNRIYDLSNYQFDEELSEKNIDFYQTLIEHCKMVKDKFYSMLYRWACEELDEIEIKQFNLLKQYFIFNCRYASYIENTDVVLYFDYKFEKEIILKIHNKFKQDMNEFNWEMRKLYIFNYDIKAKEVQESYSLKLFRIYLTVLNQVEKDCLLMENLYIEKEPDDNILGLQQKYRLKTLNEIENDECIKEMLNAGCQCISNNNVINSDDEDILCNLEGKITENNANINNIFIDFTDNSALSSYYLMHSLKEYNSIVDKSKTKYLKSLIKYKDKDPLQYYRALKKYGEEE